MMDINIARLFLIPLTGVFITYQAFANQVSVDITGKVVAPSCNVDTSSVSQEVNFGQQRNHDLLIAGSVLDWQKFTVKLINCPVSITTATASFIGVPSPDDATLYMNTGTAVNVAIQVASESDKTHILSNGSRLTVFVDNEQNATYELAGRLITPTGNAGPGTINSVLQMNFTYQ